MNARDGSLELTKVTTVARSGPPCVSKGLTPGDRSEAEDRVAPRQMDLDLHDQHSERWKTQTV